MFKKNDKVLLIARIVTFVLAAFIILVSCVFGIILAVTYQSALIFFLIFIVGLIVSGMLLLIYSLVFSLMCDVKLIRNKLYGQDNDNLAVFWRNNKTIVVSETDQLFQLLKSGVITAEEFEVYKNRLEGNDDEVYEEYEE